MAFGATAAAELSGEAAVVTSMLTADPASLSAAPPPKVAVLLAAEVAAEDAMAMRLRLIT